VTYKVSNSGMLTLLRISNVFYMRRGSLFCAVHDLLILLQTERDSTSDEAPLSTSEEDALDMEDNDLNMLLEKFWA